MSTASDAGAYGKRAEELLSGCSARPLGAALDGIVGFEVPRDQLLAAFAILRDHAELQFDLLLDVCSVDDFGTEPRFEVVYHLRSLPFNRMLRIKTRAGSEDPTVPSAYAIWPAADWLEREVYDMMGITFSGHPDLRRILMPDDFEHHPLRKDYPTRGIAPWTSYVRAGGVLTGANLDPDNAPGRDPTPKYSRPEGTP